MHSKHSQLQHAIQNYTHAVSRSSSLFVDCLILKVHDYWYYCMRMLTSDEGAIEMLQKSYNKEFKKIKNAVNFATNLGLEVHAGHGLTFQSAKIISKITVKSHVSLG